MAFKSGQLLIDLLRRKKVIKIVSSPKYRLRKKPDAVNVIGDSHSNFFSGNEMLSFVPIIVKKFGSVNNCSDRLKAFNTFHLGPALAYNINKYDTTVKAREKFEYLLKHNFIKKGSVILSCFGEIDCRMWVLRKAQELGGGGL